ncbi:MAG: hypothetical protein WC447_00155 [Candidatus Paceibacterota bacterium]|jgi:hypothetical protein
MENKASSIEISEISIRLEQYDDIFSDFDIRPYSKRALSVDFLDEIKRATSDSKDDKIELALYVEEKKREISHETVIQERLSAHFKRHYYLLMKEKRKVLKLGISMILVGIICMIIATFIIFKDPTENLLLSFLVVFLEPAAWFLLWEGMDQVVFNSKNINPDLDFYRKMYGSHEHISFKSF